MLKEQKEIMQQKKKLYFQQIKEFKQRYNRFMIGKSDLFYLMNILGSFIEFMNITKVIIFTKKNSFKLNIIKDFPRRCNFRFWQSIKSASQKS